MSRLEIRLLGGFEVWHAGEVVTGFESQKVRALLAHLVMNRDKPHSRDRLAGLLWPEKDDDTARRNLRQAVYNLRTSLPDEEMPAPPILTTHQSVQFNPETDYWLDVAAFEDGVQRGMSSGNGVDPYHLAGASDLYRGDFLTGFYVKDSPEFEHWLLYEQERLREMVIQTLRRLVDHYLTSRVYYLGVRYARRLLEIDPLFEEAHRNLMRLYALSGRRSHALEQYEECRELLRTELGVDPLEETTTLYNAILAEEWPARSVSEDEGPAGPPRLPLVGRDEAYARLKRSWEAAREGRGWLTLVEGEAGIGKTRLIEEFVQRTVVQTEAEILYGSCYDMSPPAVYQPLVEAFRSALRERPDLIKQALGRLSPKTVAKLVPVLPEIRALRPGLRGRGAAGADGDRSLVGALGAFLEALAAPAAGTEPERPLVLFLDDLHWADRSTLELLKYLVRRPARAPIWIVAAYRPEELPPDHALRTVRRELSRNRGVDRVALDRLSPSSIEQIALTLVRDDQAGALTDFLDRESAGLPLALVELTSYLCEEGILVPDVNQWSLADSLPKLAMPTPENLHDLILWRVSQLPTSARRLLTLAAVVGPQFDAKLLQEIEGEHMAVVEAGIDIWSERRFVRRVSGLTSADAHAGTEQQRHVASWGTFQFVHDQIRQAIYYDVSPARRCVMHRQIAMTLEKHYADDTERVCEALAYHYTEAQVWNKAVEYLGQAARKARRSAADDVVLYYYDQVLEVLDRLEHGTSDSAQKQTWLEQRFEVLARRSDVYNGEGRPEKQRANLQEMKDVAERLDNPDSLMMVIDRLGYHDEY